MKRQGFLATTAAVAAMPFLDASAGSAAPAPDPVTVLYAGSLVDVMEHQVKPAVARVAVAFQGEAKGSVALAREIEAGTRADVFISADPKVLEGLAAGAAPAHVAWYATFAATRLVLGYSPKSPQAALFARVAAGKAPLASALEAPGIRIARTDPALDPKGYRSILAMKLLELDGTLPAGSADKILGDARNPDQILPEESLLTRLESGDVDLAFLYRTEAVEGRFPTIDLPKSANLGDPAEADAYARATVTIDGKTHTGAPALYALTILAAAPAPAAAARFVAWIFSPPGRKILLAAGLDLIDPHVSGDRAAVPAALRAPLGLG